MKPKQHWQRPSTSLLTTNKRDHCKAACATLTPLAGGLASGEDWDDEMPEHAEFEEYYIQAKDTLIKDGNIGDKVKEHVDTLAEALCNKYPFLFSP